MGTVQMKSKANCPQMVPGVGEVEIGGTFEVSEDRALELEKGLFERIATSNTQITSTPDSTTTEEAIK